jgi:hypothetical protein
VLLICLFIVVVEQQQLILSSDCNIVLGILKLLSKGNIACGHVARMMKSHASQKTLKQGDHVLYWVFMGFMQVQK